MKEACFAAYGSWRNAPVVTQYSYVDVLQPVICWVLRPCLVLLEGPLMSADGSTVVSTGTAPGSPQSAVTSTGIAPLAVVSTGSAPGPEDDLGGSGASDMDHQAGSEDGMSGLDSGSEDETEYDVEQDLYEEIKVWVEGMNGKKVVRYYGESYLLMMNGASTASHDLRVGVGGMKEVLQYMVDRGLQVGLANLVAAVLKCASPPRNPLACADVP